MRQSLGSTLALVVMAATIAAAQFPAQPAPPPQAAAQAPAPAIAPRTPPPAPKRAPKAGEVESAPIRCWWKADRNAVRVGERFGLTLTCGVIETDAITVVPEVNQLEGGALALTPFDVVSSVRRQDVLSPPWRYVQFEYVVRLLSDGFFGQDAVLPALTVTYNLKVKGSDNEGRDQTYILPALPMRVMSVVPRAASDIRDASDQTFGQVEERRFRASSEMVGSGVFFAFALALGGLAAVAGTARFRTRTTGSARPVPAPSMLGASLRVLDDVRGQTATGWTPVLARRALAALRVGGAVGIGRPIAQEFVAADTPERDGQVAVRTGWLRPRRALLSGSATSKAVDAYLSGGRGHDPRARAVLEPLGRSLAAFNAVAYGRNGEPDAVAMGAALEEGTDAIRQLRSSVGWPARLLRRRQPA